MFMAPAHISVCEGNVATDAFGERTIESAIQLRSGFCEAPYGQSLCSTLFTIGVCDIDREGVTSHTRGVSAIYHVNAMSFCYLSNCPYFAPESDKSM